VLLSDIEMPDIDGLDMMRFAKARNSWTQIIFMTGHSSWDRIASAIEQGATDYLVKPIQREALVDLLNQSHQRATRWQQAVRTTFELDKTAAAS
jgi:YesN/AraC family two-component response regulator